MRGHHVLDIADLLTPDDAACVRAAVLALLHPGDPAAGAARTLAGVRAAPSRRDRSGGTRRAARSHGTDHPGWTIPT
ncbi:hypothetical protein ACIOWG_05095 [Streptomyces sp. NPDC087658]|uniref:hypothetical protein n=1 Tax=Streptomyces sp. NPDC087658 TaxID=3365800 RepID=UPI0037F8EFD2